jgi:muramoyltetrapeptide carboxypeptidase
MITPEYLKPGDLIAFVSPSGAIDRETVEPAIQLIERLGYRTWLGTHAFERHSQFAGTDRNRGHDLQAAINNLEVKAIICNRGGYGALRTAENIDWKHLKSTPKWLIGFSDITVLHSKLNELGMKSIHGAMPHYFIEKNGPSQSFQTLLNALEGRSNNYSIMPHQLNRMGVAKGQLVGGNLSILYSLRGTPYDLDTDKKILFIEDLSEYLYHLDRMMMNLKVSGKLKKLSGLIVGGFTKMKDNETPFGKSAEEIIFDAVRDYNYPVIFGFPAGHQPENFALKLGAEVKIIIQPEIVSITQP